jgi:hypothetical protein
MSLGIDSLHKILKDETRRKTITLLNQQPLSYTELMDALDIISTGTLNYHLKVLADFLTKNQEGQYTLTEKGKLAYRVLTEFPNTQPPITDKRILKMMLFFGIASVIFALVIGFVSNIPIERTAIVVIMVALTFGFAYYIRARPSQSGNRIFFIAVGVFVIGFLFWFALSSLILFSGLRWAILSSTGDLGNDLAAFGTLIICWILGGIVGDLIGRRRNYVIPMLRV